jgi:3-oxoacyl-[acyl-carrier protein] reductase
MGHDQRQAGPGAVSFDFSSRVALVTGSSQGIGLAIARSFVAAGASVVLNGRKEGPLEEAAARLGDEGGDVLAVRADVRDWEQVAAMVGRAVERFGTVDVLVNNAGGNFAAALEDVTPNGWRAVVDSNLTSVFYCAKACFPVFREAGGGAIVNIGSVSASFAHPDRAPYGAAKAGVQALTMSMAYEWARYGIRVNCVAPGAIGTEASRFSDPEIQVEAAAEIPVGRVGAPAEVADACLFLASAGAAFVTGTTLVVDGGPHRAMAV